MRIKIIALVVFVCVGSSTYSQASLAPQYLSSLANYGIFPRAGSSSANITQVQKPVIVIEGLDAPNVFSIADQHDMMNELGRYDMTNAGHDVIYLNFTDGGASIVTNAQALIQLVKLVNANLTPGDEISVIGYSMGGLVGRLGLVLMEAQGYEHNVKTFVSLDAPNRGANVPVSLIQYYRTLPTSVFGWFNEDIRNLNEMLKSTAAQQMLIYYRMVGNHAFPNFKYDPFFDYLENWGCGGYPEHCRNVALSLGNINGIGTGDVSGEVAMKIHPGVLLKPAELSNINSSQDPNYSGPSIAHLLTKFPNLSMDCDDNHLPVDVCPGSYDFFFSKGCTGIDNIWSEGCNSYAHKTTFIPTVSALDFNTNDLFYDISSDYNRMDKTPFDAVHGVDTDVDGGLVSVKHTVSGGSANFNSGYYFMGNHITNTIGFSSWYKTFANKLIDQTFENLVVTSFLVVPNSEVRLKDYESITFKAGTTILEGSTLEAKIVQRGKACRMQSQVSSNQLRTKKGVDLDPAVELIETESGAIDDLNDEQGLAKNHSILINEEFNFSLYPNPSTRGYVVINTNITSDIDVEIHDLNGKRVKSQLSLNAGSKLFVENLNVGIYVVKIFKEGSLVFVDKLILQ